MQEYAVLASEIQIDTLFSALQQANSGQLRSVPFVRTQGAVVFDAEADQTHTLASFLHSATKGEHAPGTQNMSKREERKKAVAQMNASFALENMQPDPHDKALQKRYVDGSATVEDLLQHAQEFATQLKANQK